MILGMDPSKVLVSFGLSQNESAVYVALLQLGPSPVLQIARRAGLKRPTTYLVLDNLMSKGLVALVPRERKKLYLALPPERLKEKLERDLREIEKFLPELTALYHIQTEKPSVQFFETIEGMMNIYRDIVNSNSEVVSFFSLETVPAEFTESFELFIRAVKEKKMKLREIAYATDKSHFYIQKLRGYLNREIRFTSANHKFFTDNFIYGSKVALFSFKKRFALVIESEDVANSMRSLFELAWQSAKRV